MRRSLQTLSPAPMASLTSTAARFMSTRIPSRATMSLRSLSVHAQAGSHPTPLRQPQLSHQPSPSTRPLSTFLSSLLPPNPSAQSVPQTLRARRVLPYSPSHLYTLIADIDSYRFFLPNCTASRVTAWTRSAPSGNQKRWPMLADLTIGWGPFTQSYTSRVYCVPGSVVEAVSGAADTTIPTGTLEQIGYDVNSKVGQQTATTGIFESLVTRWTVKPVPAGAGGTAGEWTEVTLSVQFRFANPTLGFAVGQLADDKVEEMVQAFEDRARRLYRS